LGKTAVRSNVPGRSDAGSAPDQKPSLPWEKSRRPGMPHSPKSSIESSHFSPDTLEFIRLLSSHGVRYIVVGGEAVIDHGYPRFTGDIDFFFSWNIDPNDSSEDWLENNNPTAHLPS
jgi:hypothetical protein